MPKLSPLQRVQRDHGTKKALAKTRDSLVEKIVAAKFPAGNDPFRAKLHTYTAPRLLDLARQTGV